MGEDHTYQYPQRVHGVCDIHLNPKASYDTLRKISSPVILKSFEFNNNEAVITLSGNTGIPSYVVRDYSILMDHKIIKINSLQPGEEKTFRIESGTDEFRIVRPTGFIVMHVNQDNKSMQ